MKKPLSIINIDGIDGIGKTTQVNILSNYYKDKGIPVLTLFLEDNSDSAMECIGEIWEFLDKNEGGIVISDGSIAKMIVIDILEGIPQSNILVKYKDLLHQYEILNHKYGMANILFLMDNLQECSNRIIKREKLLNNESNGIENMNREQDIIRLMRDFDSYTITRSLIFYPLIIDEDDSILAVQDDILSYLDNNFKIKSLPKKQNGETITSNDKGER